MKCLYCHREWEPTAAEEALMQQSARGHYFHITIPFCSKECWKAYWKERGYDVEKGRYGKRKKKNDNVPTLEYHQGKVGPEVKIGKGKTPPPKPNKASRFRFSGFSEFAPGDGSCMLPSEKFYGKRAEAIARENGMERYGE